MTTSPKTVLKSTAALAALVPTSILFVVVTLVVSLAVAIGSSRASGASEIPGTSAGGGSSTESLNPGMTEAGKLGCKIAAMARLSADSARGSCDAAQAIKGGKTPPAPDKCKAPTTPVNETQQEISAKSGKPMVYSQEGARCELKGTVIDNVPNGKTDCSGFATGVLMRSGLRLEPGQDVKAALTTAQLTDMVKAGKTKTCWDQVMGPASPGDMCFYNDGAVGHVWIVDRVDELKPSECTRIESTGGKDPKDGGISIAKEDGAVSDSKGSAGGCNQKEGSKSVYCLRPTGAANCINPQADTFKFKDEDKVAQCDVGPKK